MSSSNIPQHFDKEVTSEEQAKNNLRGADHMTDIASSSSVNPRGDMTPHDVSPEKLSHPPDESVYEVPRSHQHDSHPGRQSATLPKTPHQELQTKEKDVREWKPLPLGSFVEDSRILASQQHSRAPPPPPVAVNKQGNPAHHPPSSIARSESIHLDMTGDHPVHKTTSPLKGIGLRSINEEEHIELVEVHPVQMEPVVETVELMFRRLTRELCSVVGLVLSCVVIFVCETLRMLSLKVVWPLLKLVRFACHICVKESCGVARLCASGSQHACEPCVLLLGACCEHSCVPCARSLQCIKVQLASRE